MSASPCPRCGAPGGGAVCAYCGALLVASGDAHAELAALAEFHRLVDESAVKPEQCARLIVEGFIPSSREALVEAGMKCAARFDHSQPFGGCQEQWARRLELLTTKLRALHTDAGEKAAREFDAAAQRWRDADARETRNALLFFGILLALLAGVGWWLVRRFVG